MKSGYWQFLIRCSLIAATLTCMSFMRPIPSSADPKATYSAIRPSLALVISGSGKRLSIGTAFCIGSSGNTAYLLTNKHVVGNDSNPQVVLSSDPSSLLHADIVRTAILDAVVLSVTSTSCPPLTLSAAPPAVGTDIAIAGYPAFQIALSNGDLRSLAPSFHEGTVSAVASDGSWIEYDAQTDHGNSGSPLFDMQTGIVYGIVTAVNTGATGALQNNLAVAIPALSSFLGNSRANVTYANQDQTLSTSGASGNFGTPANSLVAGINARCGAGTMEGLFKTLNKAYAEESANDYSTAIGDSRGVVETASACVIVVPNGCSSGTPPCDDSQHLAVEGIQLAGQEILRISTARMHGDYVNALRNEIDSTLSLCSSPNITEAGQPFVAIRNFMSITISTVRKMSDIKGMNGLLDYDGVRECAAKIGATY